MSKRIVKKNNRRKKKGTLRTDRVVKLGLFIALIIFAIIIYNIFDKTVLSEDKINLSGENYYQYFYGLMQEYSGKIKIEKENDETKMILEDEDRVVCLDSTPIYYKDVLGKVLLPSEMELVVVDDSFYKLKNFTNIIEENGEIYSKKFNKKAQKALLNSFIYDGEDLYFFLDETIVRIGDVEYVLSPLSYAIVTYRDCIELYNYEKEEYTIINDPETVCLDAIAENRKGKYKINMSVDSLSSEKAQYLLLSNISDLKEVEY